MVIGIRHLSTTRVGHTANAAPSPIMMPSRRKRNAFCDRRAVHAKRIPRLISNGAARNPLLHRPAAADNTAMQIEPPKADPPKRKRRWFQFSLRTLLLFTIAFVVVLGWPLAGLQARASEPMPSSSDKPAQVAASPNASDLSPAKLTTVLSDPKYARLMRNDLERDLVRYYVFFEDVPRQRRKEFWNRKGILWRLAIFFLRTT